MLIKIKFSQKYLRKLAKLSNNESKDQNEIKLQFKVVLLGDGGVGKSALLHQYLFNEFSIKTQMTIGLSFHSITLNAKQEDNSFQVGLTLWDFGGQERFRPLLPGFIKGANSALLLFELDSYRSLDNLKYWKDLLIRNAGNIPFDLIGTKSDLLDTIPESCVDSDFIDQYCEELGAIHYIETSAKFAKNTDKVFTKIIQSTINQTVPDENIKVL